jgi:hypothetical protein
MLVALLAAQPLLVAQKPVFKYPFATDANTRPDVLTMPHYRSGHTAFLLKDKKKMELLLLKPDFSIASKFAASETPDKSIYGTGAVPIGAIFNGQNVYNFIFDDAGRFSKTTSNRRDAVLIDKLDFKAGNSELSLKHALGEGEKLVQAFTAYNTLYLLSVPQDLKSLNVCYIDSTLNKTVRNYPLSYADLHEGYGHLDNFLKTAKVVMPGESDADAYCSMLKIYPQPNKLYIAADFKDAPTRLITIDLYNNKLTNQPMAYGDLNCAAESGRANGSAIYDNYLFVTAACRQKLELGIFDIATGKLVKKLESGKDDAGPAFAASLPASISFSKGKNSGEKAIDNTGALCREMMSGSPGVKVLQNDAGQYIITVSAYKSAEQFSFPGVLYKDEPSETPTVYSFRGLNYGNTINIKSSFSQAGFKALLAANTFDKVKMNFKPGVLEKIRDQFSMEDQAPETATLFQVNNAWFYSWYDKETQQFTIRGMK